MILDLRVCLCVRENHPVALYFLDDFAISTWSFTLFYDFGPTVTDAKSGNFYLSIEDFMAVDKAMNVLIVDDYKMMIRIVRSLMQQLGFTNIDDAPDGQIALEKIRSKEYGLVLSDWNMTPMTGYELLKAVRAEPRTKNLPFVMVTAEVKTKNVIAARQAGASNYIIKPFTLAVLKQKLTTVFGEL